MNKKVVIDTNVIVSALMTPNRKPAMILEKISNKELQPFYYGDILAEYRDVLSRPELKISSEKVLVFLTSVLNAWNMAMPSTSSISMPDESDRMFYDVAMEVDAILITGNLKHYPPEPFIMSPVDYLQDELGLLLTIRADD
jgi:putative PIN family toxin of toxin-antitoxin system